MSRSALLSLARSLTLVAGVGAPVLAQAADLLPPPPPPPVPEPVECCGGWYLRGDVGAGALELEKVVTTVAKGSLPPSYQVDQTSLGGEFFAGAGIGYQFNGFLRGDITGEYRGGSQIGFSDSTNTYNASGNQVFDSQGKPYKSIDLYNGNLSSVVVLANGYIDLGTWSCLTPYLGAGVGTAFHTVSGFTDIGAVGAAGGFGYAPKKTSSSLAWAAQAGITYDVTPNFKVDVGYRYIDMGSAKTGAVTCYNDAGCSFASYKIKDITSHDVKIGVRYLIGGAIAAPLPPLAPAYEPAPGPLVRKY